MAENQTFRVMTQVANGTWMELARYTGTDAEPFLKACLHRDRHVQSLPDQSRYKVVNQNGQQWFSTKLTA